MLVQEKACTLHLGDDYCRGGHLERWVKNQWETRQGLTSDSAAGRSFCKRTGGILANVGDLLILVFPNQEEGIIRAVCCMISQTDASSQRNSELGAWADLWPEVTEVPVVDGNSQRMRWGGAEATFSLYHLLVILTHPSPSPGTTAEFAMGWGAEPGGLEEALGFACKRRCPCCPPLHGMLW